MSGYDNVIYLCDLVGRGLARDWREFNQADYIDFLHGGLPSRSRFDDGICLHLCCWMIQRWIKEGPSAKYIAQMRQEMYALDIVDMADRSDIAPSTWAHSDYNYLSYWLFKHGIGSSNSTFVDRPENILGRNKISHLNNFVAALCPANPQNGIGHAIIANGIYQCVFDPNIGFIRAHNPYGVERILRDLIDKKYPEFRGGILGITVCR